MSSVIISRSHGHIVNGQCQLCRGRESVVGCDLDEVFVFARLVLTPWESCRFRELLVRRLSCRGQRTPVVLGVWAGGDARSEEPMARLGFIAVGAREVPALCRVLCTSVFVLSSVLGAAWCQAGTLF